MIVGQVDEDGVPVIEIQVAGQTWPATMDTGFNGDLELPVELRAKVNAHFICRVRSFLAAGQVIEEDNHAVDFPFDGQVMDAETTFVGSDAILIGTRLLRHHRLEINFVEQTVLLERIN